jgi:hypothetical protein
MGSARLAGGVCLEYRGSSAAWFFQHRRRRPVESTIELRAKRTSAPRAATTRSGCGTPVWGPAHRRGRHRRDREVSLSAIQRHRCPVRQGTKIGRDFRACVGTARNL